MARQVNSFSELFQSGTSTNQIFEGLAEIIPPSMFNTNNLSLLGVPETEFQTVDSASPLPAPHSNAEPSSSQNIPLRKCFSQHQYQLLNAFLDECPNPNAEQKHELSDLVGFKL